MALNITRGPSRKELDILFATAPAADAVLWRRIEWVQELLSWIFSESPLKVSELDFVSGHAQALRMKWALHVLDRNPEWKSKVQIVLKSVAEQTHIFDLLVATGLHQRSGLVSEFVERIQRRILPRPPDDRNLDLLVSAAFDSEADAIAISKVDATTFKGIANLISGGAPDDATFSVWKEDVFDATSHLALQIAALGSHSALRVRYGDQSRGPSAFIRLQLLNLEWIQTSDPAGAEKLHREIQATAEECLTSIDEVYKHMDENGVSVDVVYHLERTKALISRYLCIRGVFDGDQFSSTAIQTVAARLVYDCVHAKSIRALFDDNTALIAKKIAENSAETGEHYIAKTKQAEADLFRSALGGGAITAVTTIFKYLLASLPGSPFVLSVLGSVNYSLSFIVIQLQGFSLATKQPAMTAATLADQIQFYDDPVRRATVEHQEHALQPAIDEMLAVLRSQTLAVIGNILAVVPGVFLLCGSFKLISNHSFLSEEKAAYAIESFSILGPTPFYAAWTGVLLFSSSIIAGWFYHWVLFRKLPQGMSRSRRLIRMVGSERARGIGLFFRRNAAGLAANVSLGFLLGLSPAIFQFLGIPLDVRHVTLSTGSLVAAVMTAGLGVLQTNAFWLAVAGIGSMAVLNLLISFSLALAVALRSKRISFRTAKSLIRFFLAKLARNPLLLLRRA